MKLSQLAALTGSQKISHEDPEIRGITTLELAKPGHISFLTQFRYRDWVNKTEASAIITDRALPNCQIPQLVHPNPYEVLAKIGQVLLPVTHSFSGQSPQAYVDPTAQVDPTATMYPFSYVGPRARVEADGVLYPFSYVGEDAYIGAGTVLYPSSTVMHGCRVGKRCILHANVVVGADGFGFAPTREGILKIPQTGIVVVEDEVEIGASSTVDRATYAETRLAHGVKLDSQVHVGHNVEIGPDSMLCAQVGIAGSAKIGKRFIAAGQAGVGHGITLGDHITIGPRAGAAQSESAPGEYMGTPLTPSMQWMKQQMAIKKLPDLIKTVKRLEDELSAIKKGGGLKGGMPSS
jgi:UDP-3-O-[3-hydroxymyristoyl] glucosamine N-acyltransferase